MSTVTEQRKEAAIQLLATLKALYNDLSAVDQMGVRIALFAGAHEKFKNEQAGS